MLSNNWVNIESRKRGHTNEHDHSPCRITLSTLILIDFESGYEEVRVSCRRQQPAGGYGFHPLPSALRSALDTDAGAFFLPAPRSLYPRILDGSRIPADGLISFHIRYTRIQSAAV